MTAEDVMDLITENLPEAEFARLVEMINGLSQQMEERAWMQSHNGDDTNYEGER